MTHNEINKTVLDIISKEQLNALREAQEFINALMNAKCEAEQLDAIDRLGEQIKILIDSAIAKAEGDSSRNQ